MGITRCGLASLWFRVIRRAHPRALFIALVNLYRHYISPMRPATCRFTPTCSQYAVEALTDYGALRGGGYTVVRLLKCGPWHPGGADPVPAVPRHAYRGSPVPVSAVPAHGHANSVGSRAPTILVHENQRRSS